MSIFLSLRFLWNAFLFLGCAFLLYRLLRFSFQNRWTRAKIRTGEWLKGEFFRGKQPSGPGFDRVGEAITELAGSLDKLIRNQRNGVRNPAIKALRAEAKEIVITICESVSALLGHWESLQGLDLVDRELQERSRHDARNITILQENLDSFRASLQKATVSQASDEIEEASERVVEISHFTRLMSESIGSESERASE